MTMIILCLFALCAVAQNNNKNNGNANGNVKPKKPGEKVFLEHADLLKYDEMERPGVQILKGAVSLRMANNTLKCDSAYFFDRQERYEAFGNVRIHYDRIDLSGRHAVYDDRSKQATVVGGVVVKRIDGQIFCDSLAYNDNSKWAYCYSDEGGRIRIVNGPTTITSVRGQYNTGTREADFYQDVVVKNPKYNINTETAHYDERQQMVHVMGPSTIYTQDNIIETNDGYYFSQTGLMELHGFSTITSRDGKRVITGDNLVYNEKTGDSQGKGNVEVDDQQGERHIRITGDDLSFNNNTGRREGHGNVVFNDRIPGKRDIHVTGDNLEYNEKTRTGRGWGHVFYLDRHNKNSIQASNVEYNDTTAKAYDENSRMIVKDFSQKDTLYMHCDTLRMQTFHANTDSVYREAHGYFHVRVFRNDIQAVCDSMKISSVDTCLVMYRDPIVWNESRQLLGDSIKVFMNDSTVREAYVLGQALSVELMSDSTHYNQVSSDEMQAFFVDGDLRESVAKGNVRIVFYPTEENDTTLMGLVYTETSMTRMFLEKQKLQKIWMPKSEGIMYPMTQIPPDKYYLPSFAWFDYVRPLNPMDVFNYRGKAKGTELKSIKRTAPPLQSLTE
ncbi:MAG: hypothetical protein J6Z41_01515 [Prevotella sp.]|nr:hypothetical protein [Prevotella sp.]